MATVSSTTRRPLVLIVDDNADTRDLYALGLNFAGFRTLLAADGTAGFSRARNARPDVVVTELSLPGIDGWELVRRLRAHPQTCSIPVVIVTGWTTPTILDRAQDLGTVQVLIKPCLPEALAHELRRGADRVRRVPH
jgi:CheY-like chemotaxis protein